MNDVIILGENSGKEDTGHKKFIYLPGPHPRSKICSTSAASLPGGKASSADLSKSKAGRIRGVRLRR